VLIALSGPAAAQPAPEAAPAPPTLTARGAVLWDPADDMVLYGKAEDVARPMASTTKIMTTLLALEAGAVDEQLTVSSRAGGIGEATLGLRAGQQLPVRSVLAGLMLRSGNDAAVAVAEHVAGTVDAFVAKMNARAAELGLAGTSFVNPSGLTNDPAHHASPLDLARLAEVAMGNEDLARWAGAARLDVPPFGVLANRNLLLTTYAGATGVKTGNTAVAGWCLVGSATRDGRTLFAVVLGSASADTYVAETAALLDYGFAAFRRPAPAAPGTTATTYRWAGGAVPLVPTAPLARTIPAGAVATWRTLLPPALQRPLPAGAEAGVAQLLVEGRVAAEVPLVTAAPAPAPRAARPATAAGAAVQDAVRTFVRLQSLERAA
jgi:D-alanyl-D-alanine carboxypeptidase (penicillin-binding protein 5/6)